MGRSWRHTSVGTVDDKPVKADQFLADLNEELDAVARRLDSVAVKRGFNIVAEVPTGGTEVRHNLGRIPTTISLIPRADARVWQTASATDKSIFLAASTLVRVDVYIT